MTNKVRFCWLCSKKLCGNHKEVLTIDLHPRTLHKACAKEVKKELEHTRAHNKGSYFTMNWDLPGSFTD